MKPGAGNLVQQHRFDTSSAFQKKGNDVSQFAVFHTNKKPFSLIVRGRTEWALKKLAQAGDAGILRSEHPAPRWGAYVHELRKKGVTIHTHLEWCDKLCGKIARYVLACDVRENWQL